jgi:hypothetical protein
LRIWLKKEEEIKLELESSWNIFVQVLEWSPVLVNGQLMYSGSTSNSIEIKNLGWYSSVELKTNDGNRFKTSERKYSILK